MNQEQQVQKALEAIRAINGLWSEDVAALTAALSCQIAKDVNAHTRLHAAAIEQLGDLSNWLNDEIGERVARDEAEEKKPLRQCDEEGAVQKFQSWMREVVA